MHVAVNEIAKQPGLISNAEEVVYIEDRRKNQLKSILIPAKYADLLADSLKEIEYRIWLERNRKALGDSAAADFDRVEGASIAGELE